MKKRRAPAAGQKGVALIVVLLLIATMSFIALAISERTVFSAKRSFNARARDELLWMGFGAEALARAAIERAEQAGDGAMTPETPLFARPMEFPFEGGGAVMSFADRTRCFNINSLARVDESGAAAKNEEAAAEFEALMRAAGAPGGAAMIDAIVDWIDPDSLQETQGAEDGFYAGLPTPYRTGARPVADVSELRAVAGVDRERYEALRGMLCALPNDAPARINVNMLTPDDAPVLSALTGGQLSASEAQDVIRARPPGGYASAEAFWSSGALAGLQISDETRGRATLNSGFIEAYAVITYQEATANLSMLFETDENGAPRLIRRRIERFD